MQNNEVFCYNCIAPSKHLLSGIKQPYKEFYYDIIGKLPLPDYKIAKSCLKSVDVLKDKVIGQINQIKTKI